MGNEIITSYTAECGGVNISLRQLSCELRNTCELLSDLEQMIRRFIQPHIYNTCDEQLTWFPAVVRASLNAAADNIEFLIPKVER